MTFVHNLLPDSVNDYCIIFLNPADGKQKHRKRPHKEVSKVTLFSTL